MYFISILIILPQCNIWPVATVTGRCQDEFLSEICTLVIRGLWFNNGWLYRRKVIYLRITREMSLVIPSWIFLSVNRRTKEHHWESEGNKRYAEFVLVLRSWFLVTSLPMTYQQQASWSDINGGRLYIHFVCEKVFSYFLASEVVNMFIK